MSQDRTVGTQKFDKWHSLHNCLTGSLHLRTGATLFVIYTLFGRVHAPEERGWNSGHLAWQLTLHPTMCNLTAAAAAAVQRWPPTGCAFWFVIHSPNLPCEPPWLVRIIMLVISKAGPSSAMLSSRLQTPVPLWLHRWIWILETRTYLHNISSDIIFFIYC